MALKAKLSRRERTDKEAALHSVTKEDTTRLNVLIPVNLHRQLKITAANKPGGVTITSLVIEALNDHLKQLSNE